MAVQTFRKVTGPGRSWHYIWENLGNDDTGTPIQHAGAADMSVQFYGTFGGATIFLEGSLQPFNETIDTYFTLLDSGDNVIQKTSAAGEAVASMAATIRPRTSGGTGTDLTCVLFVRSTMG